MTDNTQQTTIQRETAYIAQLNTSLRETLSTLDALASSIATLTDNMANSNKLADIYTDIHLHNRRLNATLQKLDPNAVTPGAMDNDSLARKIDTLKARKASLRAQLQSLERR